MKTYGVRFHFPTALGLFILLVAIGVGLFLVKTKTDKFELVYNRFHYFNRNINDVTVNKFIEVTDKFNLNESDRLFDVCIQSGT